MKLKLPRIPVHLDTSVSSNTEQNTYLFLFPCFNTQKKNKQTTKGTLMCKNSCKICLKDIQIVTEKLDLIYIIKSKETSHEKRNNTS